MTSGRVGSYKPCSFLEAGLCLALAVLTLLVATIPKLYVETARFIGLLSLANATILFLTTGASTELCSFAAVLLLVAMASYLPTVLDFTIVSTLIIAEYGLVLYQARQAEASDVLAFPVLLCLTLVFVSKVTTAQAEIQRIIRIEEQPQNRPQGDVLTGLPNRSICWRSPGWCVRLIPDQKSDAACRSEGRWRLPLVIRS